MSSSNDWKKTVRLNKLLGMWAAEKLGITGREAEAYSDALAVGTLDPERSDVLSKIRKDFDAAGVVQSDEQILRVLNELTLQAGSGLYLTLARLYAPRGQPFAGVGVTPHFVEPRRDGMKDYPLDVALEQAARLLTMR